MGIVWEEERLLVDYSRSAEEVYLDVVNELLVRRRLSSHRKFSDLQASLLSLGEEIGFDSGKLAGFRKIASGDLEHERITATSD